MKLLNQIEDIFSKNNEKVIFVTRTAKRGRALGVTFPWGLTEAYKIKSQMKVKITVEFLQDEEK